MRASGGMALHDGLKIRWPQGREGSTPSLPIKLIRAVGAVWLARCVDIAKATGSSPVPPTTIKTDRINEEEMDT